MVKTDNRLLAFLALQVTGDCGPFTFYYSARRQLVWFAREPALKPPSPLQVTQRAKFIAAGQQWQTLTRSQKNTWERAARRAGCLATGYNLFVVWTINPNNPVIQTIARQSATALPPP